MLVLVWCLCIEYVCMHVCMYLNLPEVLTSCQPHSPSCLIHCAHSCSPSSFLKACLNQFTFAKISTLRSHEVYLSILDKAISRNLSFTCICLGSPSIPSLLLQQPQFQPPLPAHWTSDQTTQWFPEKCFPNFKAWVILPNTIKYCPETLSVGSGV